MPSKTVIDAVAARLGNPWTPPSNPPAGGNGIPVFNLNEQATPPADGSAFLDVQYPTASETHVGLAGIGNRTFRETGTIRFVLSIPRGQGVELGLDWVDQLRALFRAAQFGGVTAHSPYPPFIDNSNDNGNYFVLSVVLPYHYDFNA